MTLGSAEEIMKVIWESCNFQNNEKLNRMPRKYIF